MIDWEKTFGGPLDDKTIAEIAKHDWTYTVADPGPIIADLNERIAKRDFSIAGENTERWQKGWQENLDEFRRTRDVAALEPKYLRPSKYLRLDGQFIEPADPMFERNWYRVFRGWFARRYLSQYDWIWEFGCGSGHNVAALAQEFPKKMIVGLDWAEASNEICADLSDTLGNVWDSTEPFDFFSPWDNVNFGANSAVLTIGALEQTGTRWRPFLDFLRRTKPAMCFHIEPIVEWYTGSPVDETAIRIHTERGFQRGFVDAITPIRKHRTGFGSLLLEGYSQLQWSPQSVHAEQAHIDALEGAP